MASQRSVPEILRDIAALEQERAALDSKYSAVSAQIVDQVAGLEKRLKKGDTTGNKLRDKLIQAYGVSALAPATFRRFEALERRLKGKKGELVLLLYIVTIQERRPFSEARNRLEKLYRLGVLAGEKLELTVLAKPSNYAELTLPVERYIGGKQPFTSEAVRKENISSPTLYHGDPPQLNRLLGINDMSWLIIGNQAVDKALRRVGMFGLYKLGQQALANSLKQSKNGKH